MTESVTVMTAPQASRLRIVAHSSRQRLLQALITPLSPWALRAVPAVLQGLSKYQAKPLCVVLCADESGNCMLLDELPVLRQRLPIGLAVLPSSHRHSANEDRNCERKQP